MNMDSFRIEIDKIDDEIIRLFKKRMGLSEEVARYKIENNLPVFVPQRERDILYRLCSESEEEMQFFIKTLYSVIFDISRARQHILMKSAEPVTAEIKRAIESQKAEFPITAIVACQGVEGAYSQIAAERIFQAPKIEYMSAFDGVFNAVDKGLCAYGILPIENSTAGSVTEVYELMKKYKFHVARSVKLRVDHTLLAKSGAAMGDIKEIFSHEQAIRQCGEFLKKNPQIKTTVCENTAVAARRVAESDRKDVAALSSKNCAALYNLAILSDDVQNSDNNYTRFICISKDLQIYRGANKISLMTALDNKPGALYALVAKFAVLGLNLTKLESRPMMGKDFEFMFYFDIDGSAEDETVVNLMGQLSESTEYFAFLGNYREV